MYNYTEAKPCPKQIPEKHEGKAYTEFRIRVYKKWGPFCCDCGRWLPLYEKDINDRNVFNVFTCAHVAHQERRAKIGDDIKKCRIKCYRCHILGEHGPQWSKHKAFWEFKEGEKG